MPLLQYPVPVSQLFYTLPSYPWNHIPVLQKNPGCCFSHKPAFLSEISRSILSVSFRVRNGFVSRKDARSMHSW